MLSIFDNIIPSSWKGWRRRSGSSDWIIKSSNNGYCSPNSLAHSPPKLSLSHPNALGISPCVVVWRIPPYLGLVICCCSEVPSRFSHYYWPICPEQRWCRGPMGSPSWWNCWGTVNGLQELSMFKATPHGHFSNVNVPKNHWKILQKKKCTSFHPIPRYPDSVSLFWDQEPAHFVNIPDNSDTGTDNPCKTREIIPKVSAPPSCCRRHSAINNF